MESFTKYYSYNQLIEEHDILVMTEQEYLANKNQLDNPQRIVLVNREGGPKEPKIPKWFQSYKQEVDNKFKDINNKFKDINNKFKDIDNKFNNIDTKMPEWFKQWNENVYEKRQPKWFTSWCEQEFKPLVKDVQNIKDVLKRNNLQ